MEACKKELKQAMEEYNYAKNAQKKTYWKKKCVNLMKKKKMIENHITTLENTQMNVEQVHMTTEIMRDNLAVMSAMKSTTAYQKQLMKDLNVDNLTDAMDEMNDMKEDMEEFTDAMNENFDIEVDDAEIDAEIQCMNEELNEEMNASELNVPAGHRMVSKEAREEKELEDMLK